MLDSVGQHWRGRWLALDLPGHGGSGRQAQGYRLGQTAAVVAHAIQGRDPRGGVVVLGHSLGGVVALALASGWFAVRPDHVLAVGVKCRWSDADALHMSALASRAPKIFPDAAAAWALYLKVSGLVGLVDAGAPALSRGVAGARGAWRLSMDPAANDTGLPPLTSLVGAAACPLHLARGALDAIVSLEDLRALHPSAVDLASGGHNVMVEAPDRVWDWIAAVTEAAWQPR
jgi:pimeloyl-ACP methyl ester carboxylesterase